MADRDELCWFDKVGDALEKEGIKPGNIFEFHKVIAPGWKPGGIVVTNGPEGIIPRTPESVVKVLLRDFHDAIHEISPRKAIFAMNFISIRGQLC